MNLLNQQFELIRQSPTVAMADRVNALKAQGYKIIGLQTGDPDFATPEAVLDMAAQVMRQGLTHYGPSRGFPDFRRSAAEKLERDNGVTYDPETEIMATHGGIHAFYTAMQALINPGDDVLIPDPTWATHANMAIMLRGNAIRVPAPAENGFLPSFADWEKSLTARTRIIVINYPSNPTGIYPSRDYMQALQDFAADHDLWVISDEVYENLYFGDHPTCAAAFPRARERTVLVQSLSKTYAMTGWRVGYLAAPAAVIENALKASQNSITCVAPFVQKAAAFALSDAGVQKAAAEMRDGYARRRQLVLTTSSELMSKKVFVTAPMGAFYFFLDLRSLEKSSIEICENILSEMGVGLVAGAAFGQFGEGFVRMTIAASDNDVYAGFSKVVEWADRQ
ncbi:MAG: aminotransferase class I/II-fold pyridoxal phosphate-dependent enzyme [Chloroflexi bacterium]|nr:aminotransferase class I/II-fold pyridoxal phosphate-dependent enzyme [Chloroflexota bacterium]